MSREQILDELLALYARIPPTDTQAITGVIAAVLGLLVMHQDQTILAALHPLIVAQNAAQYGGEN